MPEFPIEIDLSGEDWLIRHDPDDAGERAGWHASVPHDAARIRVPSSWQHVLGEEARGVAWYWRSVRLPSAPERARWRLRFDAVATHARVWVDGRPAGEHVGDYVPFEVEVARGSRETREVLVAVRVDQMHAPRPAPGTLTENGHITKGFHDVLSLQKAGLWERVRLRATGPASFIPDGLVAQGDPSTGRVVVRAEMLGRRAGAALRVEIADPARRVVATGEARAIAGAQRGADAEFRLDLRVPDPRAWEPDSPVLYSCRARLIDAEGGGTGGGVDEASDAAEVRFGFRTLSVGGRENRRLLLNGRPLLVRGVLHWGHEPRHVSPAPPREQIAGEFARLRAMGFNAVCLCMVYMGREYYDAADEAGMLLWQEHPVWKSRMDAALLDEYRRVLSACFRRDRSHASVAIVSGSCEHECIHPDLAAWWWAMARREIPDRVAQVQTAFIAWTNPHQTDLHDEHVYDNTGRWTRFVEDLEPTLAELPARPFVMGETIIGTSWVDTRSLGGIRSWWRPRGVVECAALEDRIRARYGEAVLDRFRRQANDANLSMRQAQVETLRTKPFVAGWVMNQIRDVPLGRLGFMDDLDRWRFEPERTRAWLGERAIVLRTPDQRRGFYGDGSTLPAELGVSNFARDDFDAEIDATIGSASSRVRVRAQAGEAEFVPLPIALPRVERPTRLSIRARAAGAAEPNAWDLWLFPRPGDAPAGVSRLDGLPLEPHEAEPEFEERAYSSGWGMACRSWSPVVQQPQMVLFKTPLFRFDAPMPHGTRVVAAHRLTRGLVEFMEGGGRVLLLAGRGPGSFSTRFVCFWGQCPLVPEEPPLEAGDSAWIIDLLHNDLSRRTCRAIPSEELGIADDVDPIVRLVFTHDQGRPRIMDSAFVARVGRGLLLATALDHTEDAGQFVLHRFLAFLTSEQATARAALDASRLPV